ncbi:MAG: RNA-binding transcriptional accessory protein [Deltaproteobacteria bacterium]|nr:RNA-binding transcriptional accessory protein [Candidatus Tharpella sp.]
MTISHYRKVAAELGLAESQVKSVAGLFSNGATVPFIARYRKEATGSLDEVAIKEIEIRLEKLAHLEKRRQAIYESLTELKLLTPEFKRKLDVTTSLAELEDLYLPYRPKRRTRATIARERGLQPLAEILFRQQELNPEIKAQHFIDPKKDIHTLSDALAGARDIIAEKVNEDINARTSLRRLFTNAGEIKALVIKGKEQEGIKFRDYFDWREKSAKVAGHRLLAMLRGEREKILRISIRPPLATALEILRKIFIKGDNASTREVETVLDDAYKRLLAPTLENELRQDLREKAEIEAIEVFAINLRELLLAPPLGPKRILALDPGFRSGAKFAVLSETGELLKNGVIYPTTSTKARIEAAAVVTELCARYRSEAVAIGNGTAGRETETFIRELDLPEMTTIAMVSEAGASVYSASEIAREEFPNHDITVRGAVSIGRRLQDPLSELIKIDAKAIGVGQYQHDVDQKLLRQRLDYVAISCVNNVGVEVNNASVQLLAYVAGLNQTIARNIVKYRTENGPFRTRKELLKVPRLGAKAFEQAAGFLRVRESVNPLDSSAVHPEHYALVAKIAQDCGVSIKELITNEPARQKIVIENYISETVGRPTLEDIVAELNRPGRDPRSEFVEFHFQDGVNKITDLNTGMRLPGLITNITKFGAFVDIGVHQDGLIHISQLANRFVRNPEDIVKLGQAVNITVLEVDLNRQRIALSLKTD